MKFYIYFVLISLVANLDVLSFTFKRVCYLRVDRSLQLSSVPPDLCTHIILGFASVSNQSIVPTIYDDRRFYLQTIDYKTRHPDVRLMLSVGGGGNDNGFHHAAENPDSRSIFANSAINLLKDYSFDGIDIDWEFPVWNGFRWRERRNFVLLLQTLRNALDNYQMEIQRLESFLISAAVAGSFTIIRVAYDVPEIVKHVDFINLMTYDLNLFNWYSPFAEHNSPLFSHNNLSSLISISTTAWASEFWHYLGVPKDKILVGIPTYARKYRLAFSNWFKPGALAISNLGDASFPQVCGFLKIPETRRFFDHSAKVPYAVNTNVWVSYEDEESVYYKVMWIMQNKFGGVMTYSLNHDDYENSCREDKIFVLHSAISEVIKMFANI